MKRTSPCLRCSEKKRLNNPNSVIGKTVLRRRKLYLSNPNNIPSIIIRSARHYDKTHTKYGFDLDHDFVSALIADGCKYCGINNVRMTLDRIDNQLGHLKSNVHPACVRCNHIRGSMPFDAWMNMVPSIRKTYELGLFADWWIDTKSIYKSNIIPFVSSST